MNHKVSKMTKIFDKVFHSIVLVLFGLFVGYLTLLSLFSTNYCFVGVPGYYVSDSPWKALICFGLLLGILCITRKSPVEKVLEKWEKPIWIGCNILLFGILLWFVMATQLKPHGDQLAICNAAEGLRKYDFSLFTKGNYFDYWPFQSRIVVFLWGFFSVFGNSNYLAFQVMNVFCIVISINLVAAIFTKTSDCCTKGRRTLIFTACMMFLPYLLYVPYIYGNIAGFTFILAAIYMLVSFRQTDKDIYLAGTVFFCAIGVWLKNTYQICMIAIVIFLLVDFWQRKKWKSIAGMVGVVAVTFLIGACSDAVLENRMGFSLSEGTPMTAWITMAFSEDEEGNPVKYDAYNIDIYKENGMDSRKAGEKALEDLKKNLENLTDSPAHFLRFMGRKIALEWNEPTFESLVADNRAYPQVEEPVFIKKLLQQDNRNPLIKYANLFHALTLMGTFAWVFLKGRKGELFHFIFAVIFIGGFLFQLFWETLAQYTLMYFLILIPYAVEGYQEAAKAVCTCVEERKVEKKAVITLGIMASILAIIGFVPSDTTASLFKLSIHDEFYAKVLQDAIEKEREEAGALPDGHYVVSPVSMPDYGIASVIEHEDEQKEKRNMLVLQKRGEDFKGILELHHEYYYDLLRIQKTQFLLSLSGEPENGEVQVGQDYDFAMWKIRELPEGGYVLMYNDVWALAVKDEKLVLEPFTGELSQKWIFERKS